MGSLLIDVNNVSKIYRNIDREIGFKNKVFSLFKPDYTNHYVLKDMSFTLFSGQSLAILGPNGAGKSTLIKILSGIQYADEGCVKVLGVDPYKAKKNLFKSLVIRIVYGGICPYATVWIWFNHYMVLNAPLLPVILKRSLSYWVLSILWISQCGYLVWVRE